MADAIKQVDEQLLQLNLQESENSAQQRAVKSQIEQLAAEYKMQEADVKQAFQREQEHLEADRSKIREQVARIDGLLAHLDGSLYKWLCENTEGWENTIGKVVDEERVLYAEGLEPRLSGASDGLFGIQLNLDNIDSVHRTPDEYRAEKKRLEELVQQLEHQLAQLLANHEDEMAKLRKKYAALINPLRQSATLLKVEEEQIPGKRQELQIQRHKLEMEEQEEIARETEVRQRACNDAVLKVQSEKEAREKNELKNKKDLKDLDSAFDKASKALDAECLQSVTKRGGRRAQSGVCRSEEAPRRTTERGACRKRC